MCGIVDMVISSLIMISGNSARHVLSSEISKLSEVISNVMSKWQEM